MKRGVDEIDQACEEARALVRVEHGHITVGTLASLAVGVVTRAVGGLRKGFPGIKVSMREDYNGALLERVAQGEVDFAVCAQSGATEGLSFEHLFDDELVAVMPLGDSRAGARPLRWSALKDESLVMTMRKSSTREHISAALAAHGITREADYDVANMFTALSMVRAGLGVTFIPLLVLPEVNMKGLGWARMAKPAPVRRIGICRRSDRTASVICAAIAPDGVSVSIVCRQRSHIRHRHGHSRPVRKMVATSTRTLLAAGSRSTTHPWWRSGSPDRHNRR